MNVLVCRILCPPLLRSGEKSWHSPEDRTDLEALIGQPAEHIQFALWYLSQKQYVAYTDNSQLMITADGVDYLEAKATLRQKLLRLRGSHREGH